MAKHPPDGGSAFPFGSAFCQPQNGMTLRDYFAAEALAGLLASGEAAPWAVMSENAYRIADAMLASRGAK